jgi:hypothetical protein
MAKLDLSQRLFAGALVHFALEASGTSDSATKPASDNAAWKQIGSVLSLTHMALTHEEPYSEPDATRGWVDRKEIYHTGDVYDLVTQEVSGLYHQLANGLNAAIVAGTAQAPFVKSERMVRGWIKVQQRQSAGTDRDRLDLWCEVRVKAVPPIEKKVQTPTLELFVLASSLNSYVLPS